jgi:predicted RND superfamily exporter protein
MKKRNASRIITFGGIGAIAMLVAFMVFLQVEAARNNEFKRAFEKIVIDINMLTQEYQAEEGKWPKEYDNATMIAVVDQYLPSYEEIIDRAKALDTPERYKEAHTYLVSAIDSEKQSNEHFRNYLVTGDQSEYERSSELLTKSLADSVSADAAIKAAG